MTPNDRMRHYQQQDVRTATPEQLILKLYDLGLRACRTEDRSKVRGVLVELIGSLDVERGGELASQLLAIYDFCMQQSVDGDLAVVEEILADLRAAWREGVMSRQAA